MPPWKQVTSHLGGERDEVRRPRGLTDRDKEKDQEHRCPGWELGEVRVSGAASSIGGGFSLWVFGAKQCITPGTSGSWLMTYEYKQVWESAVADLVTTFLRIFHSHNLTTNHRMTSDPHHIIPGAKITHQ